MASALLDVYVKDRLVGALGSIAGGAYAFKVQTAMNETALNVRDLADAYPEFREIGKRMLTEWEQGALDITPTVTAKSRAGQTLKQSVGLSDAGKSREVKKKTVYRNPDGPLSRKSR
jgi:serine/threonine-protein kinase HipA